MNPVSIGLFCKFKRSAKGAALKDPNGNDILDIYGNPVLCQGGWNLPANVDQLLSAVGVLHASRGQRGPYQDTCKNCVAESQQGNYQGCRFHPMKPQIWRTGNPKESNYMADLLRQNTVDGSSYIKGGSTPLTPWELIAIKDYCVSSNKLWELMFWTMTIVATKLFLRHDEITNLKFSDANQENCLNKELTVFNADGSIESLAFFIKGKCDPVRKCLILWADHQVPDLCPVRALVLWTYMSKIKDGYLFPPKEALRRIHATGISDCHIEYGTY